MNPCCIKWLRAYEASLYIYLHLIVKPNIYDFFIFFFFIFFFFLFVFSSSSSNTSQLLFFFLIAAHLRIVVASGLLVLWNQVHCSLLDSRSSLEMTKTCSSLASIQNVPCKLIVYGALAGGFLTDKWLGGCFV